MTKNLSTHHQYLPSPLLCDAKYISTCRQLGHKYFNAKPQFPNLNFYRHIPHELRAPYNRPKWQKATSVQPTILQLYTHTRKRTEWYRTTTVDNCCTKGPKVFRGTKTIDGYDDLTARTTVSVHVQTSITTRNYMQIIWNLISHNHETPMVYELHT